MTRAYEESYLNDAMNNLGDMFEYAVCDLDYDIDGFMLRFIGSGVAAHFEKGNPKYVAGLSGAELANEVVFHTEGYRRRKSPARRFDRTPEYWTGWALAYYQWYTAYSFEYLQKRGLTPGKVIELYPTLHEADVSKFVSVADGMILTQNGDVDSNLKRIRKARGLTQRELSERSGVSLRMIQQYEQKQRDINKAEAKSLIVISNILGCTAEELLE